MPSHSTPSKPQFLTAGPCSEPSPVTILFIEDNEPVMNLVKEVLEHEGWSVQAHQDGFSALRKLESDERYELIITDNDLPGLRGIELIQRTRKMPHHQHTPIIMLSANPYQAEAMRAGADAFLRKPEDVFAIPQTVTRLLSRLSNHAEPRV